MNKAEQTIIQPTRDAMTELRTGDAYTPIMLTPSLNDRGPTKNSAESDHMHLIDKDTLTALEAFRKADINRCLARMRYNAYLKLYRNAGEGYAKDDRFYKLDQEAERAFYDAARNLAGVLDSQNTAVEIFKKSFLNEEEIVL